MCFCSLAKRLEHYAAHNSPGVESAINMMPGSCFSANTQQTDSGYCDSIAFLSRSNSILSSPGIQSDLISKNELQSNDRQVPDHVQPIHQDQPPHIISCEISQQQMVDSLSSQSVPHIQSGNSTLPHIQPVDPLSSLPILPHPNVIPVNQLAPQSHFISPNDLAAVQFALMHNRHCKIPGCCCHTVKELLEGNRGRMPHDSPKMGVTSCGNENDSRAHIVASSTDSDSDYSSYTDRRSRPLNLRLLSNEHNRNPNLHPHYHFTTKSYMRRVSAHAPIDHRRSKSLADLTPINEVPEAPAKSPAATGGSIKAGTPVYYCPPMIGEHGQEKPTSLDDCSYTNQPMLLREISISADNIPALCLNDCPFTPSPPSRSLSPPSPLKEGSCMLSATLDRKSFQGGSMRSTKPKLKTVKEKTNISSSDSEAEEELLLSTEAKVHQSSFSSDPAPSSAHIRHPPAAPYETVVTVRNGVVTETTEC